MTGNMTLAARRLALFGPPLALGVLSFTHTAPAARPIAAAS